MQARRKGKYILFPWDVALCFSSFVFVHVKYMMYRAGEPEEQEEEEEEEKRRKENWRRVEDLKHSTTKTANDFHGRIITTPFVFCPGDKSLVDSVSMREVSFPSFPFSS